MFHPLVSRRALCVLALGAAACGTLATAPDAIDKTTKCKGGQLLVKIGKTRVCKRTATLFPEPDGRRCARGVHQAGARAA